MATVNEWNPMAQAFEPAAPTLGGFLLARIAEDERVVPTPDFERKSTSRAWYSTDFDVVFVEQDRWLAECAAKRRIVELHRIETQTSNVWHDRDDGLRQLIKATEYSCAICGWVMEDGPEPSGVPGCDTLRALALPYVGHPDYRAEWRP